MNAGREVVYLQGFSLLNRFPNSAKARHDRGVLLTCLSAVDIFKPEVFIMENVAGMALYDGGTALEATLACLTEMGYQVWIAT